MSKLSNALTMLNILSARSVVSLQELSDILEINIRSVQRLKDDLEYSGYQIETVMGPGGGYQLKNNTQIQSNAFTLDERRKLKQALAMLLHQNSKTFDKDFVALVSKLSSQLHFSKLENTMAFQSVKLNVDPIHYNQLLSDLEKAIAYSNVVKINYKKNHRTNTEYMFQPYELLLVNQFWYIYGYDQLNRYISLKVNRINSLEVLDKTFAKEEVLPKRQALNEYGYSIDPEKAIIEVSGLDYLSEYIWGKNQKINWLDDHRFYLEVEFPNAIALKDFALRGGANIKVIEPKWLVNFLIESYENAMKQYNF